ncbi:hypothetical protein FA048_12935 [Pedobacter polaris]|uniref:DUF5007 domain-containing protein n=1 Tax=Pedobacter polaris TaxID=2571273 RepID=A0A4U1CR26_9SPHI|nr:hypothetical protein [Pedobacter polaris]TKC08061.1 hypothetical protein FA048_12935 [Pedobacter polaris]
MNSKYKILYLSIVAFIAILYGCAKVEKGFISDYMYYSPNPLIATQGNVTTSKALELDGSSGPVTVKLLAVRNSATGKDVPEFLKEYMIQQFNAQITVADSTIALVNKKIELKPSVPLTVGEIGGRIALSQATANVPTGDYVIDVQVSNAKGTRTLLNACRIKLTPKVHYAISTSPFYTTSDVGAETGFSASNFLPITVTHDATGPNKIIFKFLDKNGAVFNAAAGEVVTRGDRGNMSQMNPYFPVVKTTTGLEWGFIQLPNGFPIKDGNNGTGNYYRIPGQFTVENRNANPVFFDFKVFSAGTYTVTVQIPAITRKP